MRFLQKILHHPAFLISILLAAFFLKGVFLATLFPVFTGQDEARHYNSIQYLNEPAEKVWEKDDRGTKVNNDAFSGYNFSEEILNTGTASGIDDIRSGLYNTADFSDTSMGKNEQEILEKQWKPYNFFEKPDAIRGSLYHTLAAKIEGALSDQNILVRFFSVRLFSLFLGTIAVFLAFLIARAIGFSSFISTLFAALVAFQPKFAMYTTNINYDALLIPLFFLFTLGGVMSLKKGLDGKSFSIMFLALTLGLFTKGTVIVLLVVFIGLIGFHLFKKVHDRKRLLLSGGVFLALSTLLLGSRYNLIALIPFKGSLLETFVSLGEYLSKSLTLGHFGLSSRTYWGSLGWNDNFIAAHLIDIVWPIEMLAGVGIILFLFTRDKPDFLPEKKYIFFLLALIVALQLGIRMADWNVFISTHSLDLGTPGRYFLPNLATHFILLFVGLGMLFGKRTYFKNTLIGGVILMFFFSLYLTFDVILPRFYL